MPAIGVTGGVASGKSSVAQALGARLGVEVFSADACARDLADHDPEARAEIAGVFGQDVFKPDGGLDRVRIREMVFADAEKRSRLEAILHPRIRARWVPLAREARGNGAWWVAEIPLLFETGAEAELDGVIAVACSESVQLERLARHRGLDPAVAGGIIGAQAPMAEKTARADWVIWNDGTPAALERQVDWVEELLRQRYG